MPEIDLYYDQRIPHASRPRTTDAVCGQMFSGNQRMCIREPGSPYQRRVLVTGRDAADCWFEALPDRGRLRRAPVMLPF